MRLRSCSTETSRCPSGAGSRESGAATGTRSLGLVARVTTALQFMVNRPEVEPGYRLDRQEPNDRVIRYSLHAYAAEKPHGTRFRDDDENVEPD